MATKWEPFHERGSSEVVVNRNDGLVMVLAEAINPLAAAAITDTLKHVRRIAPEQFDKIIEAATLYQA